MEDPLSISPRRRVPLTSRGDVASRSSHAADGLYKALTRNLDDSQNLPNFRTTVRLQYQLRLRQRHFQRTLTSQHGTVLVSTEARRGDTKPPRSASC